MTTLNWDLKTLFLYLANATLCIDDKSKDKVFNGMAYKMMEWDTISRCELRKVIQEFGIQFEELCSNCNEPLPDYNEDEENPKYKDCSLSIFKKTYINVVDE